MVEDRFVVDDTGDGRRHRVVTDLRERPDREKAHAASTSDVVPWGGLLHEQDLSHAGLAAEVNGRTNRIGDLVALAQGVAPGVFGDSVLGRDPAPHTLWTAVDAGPRV